MALKIRHSVMVGFMGRQADRFHQYQPGRDLSERLDMAIRTEGAQGVEVVYPGDFADVAAGIAAIRECGLPVSAVNLDVKRADKWRRGSFTAAEPATRADAVADLKTAMDLAAELGAEMVTCCPLIDGHNYNFEADYALQWQWLQEGLAEGAAHRSDIRVSLEYKLNEARTHCILGDMGRALYLCERIDLPNVGVTMDMGHALLAKETPAEMLALGQRAGRLFYVHLNDNNREWDWDMLPGSVNLWDLLETVFYMDRLGWQGWIAYDVVPRQGDPVDAMSSSISIVKMAEQLLDQIGRGDLEAMIREGVPSHTVRRLVAGLLREGDQD